MSDRAHHNHRVEQRSSNTSTSLLDNIIIFDGIIRPFEACHFIDWASDERPGAR